MNIRSEKLKIKIKDYTVSAEILLPEKYEQALIVANGAGVNMQSPFISGYCQKLSQHGFMTVKFNFHYQEIGKKIPDKNEKCQETYLGIIDFLRNNYLTEKQINMGGKSMGGRIATQIAHKVVCPKMVIFGYPLHPPGKPEKRRDAHLYAIRQDVFIVQGENDALGTQQEMQPVVSKMQNAQVLFIEQANHSLDVPKKSGLDTAKLEEKIINAIVHFLNKK